MKSAGVGGGGLVQAVHELQEEGAVMQQKLRKAEEGGCTVCVCEGGCWWVGAKIGQGRLTQVTCDLSRQLPTSFPMDFACGKPAGKVTNGDCGTLQRKCERVAKCLNFVHLTVGIMQERNYEDRSQVPLSSVLS